MDDLQNPSTGEIGLPNLAWMLFQENGQIGMYSLFKSLSGDDREDERFR